MSHYGSPADEGFTIRYVRRGDRWVAEVSRKTDFWPMVVEWATLTAVACAIVTLGPIVGYLSAKARMDVESRAVAATTALRALNGTDAVAETCSGHSRISPFSSRGLITARYLCELSRGGRAAIAAVALRDEPDAWKITALYVLP